MNTRGTGPPGKERDRPAKGGQQTGKREIEKERGGRASHGVASEKPSVVSPVAASHVRHTSASRYIYPLSHLLLPLFPSVAFRHPPPPCFSLSVGVSQPPPISLSLSLFVFLLPSLFSFSLSLSFPSFSVLFLLTFLSFPFSFPPAASQLWARRRYHRGNRHSIRRDESILFPAKNKLLVGASRERAAQRNGVSLAALSPLRPFPPHSLYVRVWLFFNRSFALALANCALFFSSRILPRLEIRFMRFLEGEI